nr:TPA_asm: penton [Pimephales minnow adintovirus]
MDEHGFYVTLPCNASSWVYPENTISSYITRLAKAINLKGHWQVGLAEIEYPRTWYSFSDEDGNFTLHTAPGPQNAGTLKDSELFKKDLSGFSVSRKLEISGGYYANIRAIIRAINKVLQPTGLLDYDEIKNKVYLLARPNVSVTFYGKLATILGVIPNEALGRTAYHKEADFNTSTITYAPHQADINGGFYTLYVYTDIVQYQVVGDSHVPLLRCVHISGKTNETVIARYDKPHYASIIKDHITDITIEVKDDQNKPVPFTYGKVIVKLHFKPKNELSL